jgi:transcriptional regulator with XRE-family HTH domain
VINNPDNEKIKPKSVFAKRLKEARLRVGLSQEKLGVLAGIDEFSASARINQYERGKHIPDLDTAERLAEVLNVPAPFFYAKEDDLADWIISFKPA